MHHELEKFITIVETGSYTAAAKQAHVSQPALTAAVQSLEKRYGRQLIRRGTRPLQLTEAGRLVYASAHRMRLEHSRLISILENSDDRRSLTVSIGAIDSIAALLLERGVDTHDLEIQVDNSARLLDAVRLQRLELALVTLPLAKSDDGLLIKKIYDESFYLVARPSLAPEMEHSLLELGRLERFATYDPESTTAKRIAAAARDQDIRLIVSFSSSSPELIRQAVLNGNAVALLPEALVNNDISSGALVRLPFFNFSRPIALARNTDAELSGRHIDLLDAITYPRPFSG
jgi:DNA-binding transcriptional LysR family regulator